MCFLAFVCHSAQWRAAVIGIGNALASLSLILLTLGYKVGKTNPMDTIDDKQWHTCSYSVLKLIVNIDMPWLTISCQVAKLFTGLS